MIHKPIRNNPENAMNLSTTHLAAIYYTWQNRFLCPRHYFRKFWPDSTLAAVLGILGEICEAGYLRRIDFPTIAENQIYCSTKRGNSEIAKIGLISEGEIMGFPRRPEELSNALRHDLTVTDLRIAFEESG